MLLGDPSRTGASHLLELRWGAGENFDHRIDQGIDVPGRNKPTANIWLDQFRMRCDRGGDDRATQRQRFEEYARQALGKARQNHRTGGQDLIEDSQIIQVAGESNMVSQAKLGDEPLDFAPHRAVTRDDKLDINTPFQQMRHSLDQDRLTFLFDDPTDIYHSGGIRNRGWSTFQVHGVHAGIDNTDLGPISVFGPAENLTSREVANSGNKGGVLDFLS